MDRYFINWSYENVDKDEQGDFVYYSDVKDLETKLEQAQFTINQLDLALVLERERLAEAQADNMALVEALRKSLLLWKGWGNNNYAEDACYQSNLKVLEQPHPGDSLRKELKELQEGKAIYEAYDGSKLDKADQYIERLEKELEQYKRALELCCRAHRPTEARLQGMINGFLAQAKTGEANA